MTLNEKKLFFDITFKICIWIRVILDMNGKKVSNSEVVSMIISTNQIQSLIGQYEKKNYKVNGKENVNAYASLKGTDKVQVSQDAQAYLVAREAIRKVPETRDEKVAHLSELVRTGNYNVDSEEIAEKMIGRNLVDKMI